MLSWPHGHCAEAGTGGAPCVDILVATPGRLMAHMKGTPGATLEHLRYLVSEANPKPSTPKPHPL